MVRPEKVEDPLGDVEDLCGKIKAIGGLFSPRSLGGFH